MAKIEQPWKDKKLIGICKFNVSNTLRFIYRLDTISHANFKFVDINGKIANQMSYFDLINGFKYSETYTLFNRVKDTKLARKIYPKAIEVEGWLYV